MKVGQVWEEFKKVAPRGGLLRGTASQKGSAKLFGQNAATWRAATCLWAGGNIRHKNVVKQSTSGVGEVSPEERHLILGSRRDWRRKTLRKTLGDSTAEGWGLEVCSCARDAASFHPRGLWLSIKESGEATI